MDDQPRVGTRTEILVRFHVDEVQELASTASAGGYRLTHRDRETSVIPWDATSQDVEDALVALPNVGAGGVFCTGGPHPATPIRVQFTGRAGKRSQPTLQVDASGLTGGVAVTTPQAGGPTPLDAVPTVRVEDPEGSVTSQAPVDDLGGGSYRAVFVPVVAGRHLWAALGSSSVFGAVEVEAAFTVAPRDVDEPPTP